LRNARILWSFDSITAIRFDKVMRIEFNVPVVVRDCASDADREMNGRFLSTCDREAASLALVDGMVHLAFFQIDQLESGFYAADLTRLAVVIDDMRFDPSAVILPPPPEDLFSDEVED
jgi:hypothetical protein